MIYFYTIGDERVASSRMRVWHLARMIGVENAVTVIHPYRSWHQIRRGRLRDFFVLLYRIIFYQRALFYVHKVVSPPEIVLLFGCVRSRVVFDFDDQIQGHWAMRMLKQSSRVVVSSHALMGDAKKYNSHVVLIPTAVPLTVYVPTRRKEDRTKLVIGWIGSGKGQVESLLFVEPILERLRASGAVFEFRLIGAEGVKKLHEVFSKFGPVVDEINWSSEQEIVTSIQEFDIGIMPLVDTPRNQRKAAFKLIQYMALGIPVVASAVGENTIVVGDGVGGYGVTSEDEWVEALRSLSLSSGLRQRLGERGREKAEKEYSLESAQQAYRALVGLGDSFKKKIHNT